jgi:hypothetical protein
LTRTESGMSGTQATVIVLRRVPQYANCVGLGLLGGAIGAALAIGLAILSQLLLPPSSAFSLGIVSLMVMASLAGLGASWLLCRAACPVLTDLLHDSRGKGLQMTLVISVLTSLLQILFFFVRT